MVTTGRRFLPGPAVTMLLLIVSIHSPLLAEGGPVGAIRGTVTDHDSGAPLAQVRVSVLELPLGAISGADGTFLIEHVLPGSYTLALSRDGYDRSLLTNVAVSGGRMSEVRAELVQVVFDLDELVVSGAEITQGNETGALE